MEMMSRNLQHDDGHSVNRHNDLPLPPLLPLPADVGDIIMAPN